MPIRHNNNAVVAPLTLVSSITYLIHDCFIIIKQECDDVLNNVAHLGDKGTKNIANMQIKSEILVKRRCLLIFAEYFPLVESLLYLVFDMLIALEILGGLVGYIGE